MKKTIYALTMLLLGFLLLPAAAWAQVQVTGKVTDATTGEPLPGVAVTVEGTTIGTQTDLEGNYEINVPNNEAQLQFRFLGYANQTAPASQSIINIQLKTDTQALNEVVVTALGIQRSRNELPYAAQEVSSEELTRTRGGNFMDALSGKVSGLSIKQNNSMGGSTNVIIRGYKSITGNNQALFVIDGVPVSNANTNTTMQQEGQGGYDYGNAAADINPDNIASVNVLKGAAATALYGSRAANGVIMITTKKGKKNSLEVIVNSGFTVGSIDKTTFAEYQDEYGAGYEDNFYDVTFNDGDGAGKAALFNHDASFGPKFDPSLMVYHWNALDPASPYYHQKRPWVAAPNDPSTFYQNSTNSNQSIVLRGGGEQTTFKAGYTRIDEKGILPNSTLDKNLFNFSATYDALPNLQIAANANYSKIDGLGRYGTGYDGRNPNQQFRQWWQVNTDIEEQKEAYFRNRQNITWNWADLEGTGPIYSDNPYWTRYENYENDTRNRYFGYASVNWVVNDWLSIMGRAAIDASNEFQEERIAVGSAGGVAAAEYERYDRTYSEANYDLMLNFKKSLSEDISFTGLLGGNMRRLKVTDVRASTNGGLAVPGLYSLSNSISPIAPPVENYERIGVDGVFASATLGYKETYFLDLAGRRDQSTTLPDDNDVYYYPSIAGSFLFSNVIENAPWLSYGKLRVNYAEVGNDAPALALLDVYDKPVAFGNIPIFSLSDTKNNEELKPERTKSIEAGLDMAFLDNRFGFDFTWYKTNTIDQILPIIVTAATGYTQRYVNSGEVENKGIELSAFFSPVVSDNFSWRMNVNFTRNRSEVLSLYGEGDSKVENIPIGNFQAATANMTVGQPYGVLKGTDFVYHPDNGMPIIESNGYYRVSTTSDKVIGNPNPDWIGGIGNTFRFKDVSLSFLVDVRHGGDIFSLDQWYGMATGLYPETAGLNELGNPKRAPVSEGGGILLQGVQEDGTRNETRAALSSGFTNPYGYISAPEASAVFDASYVKLREASLTWSLPAKWMENLRAFEGIDISVIGRNLWIIHKNLPYADPEEEDSAGNINGYQGGAYPTVRTIGMNVKFRF